LAHGGLRLYIYLSFHGSSSLFSHPSSYVAVFFFPVRLLLFVFSNRYSCDSHKHIFLSLLFSVDGWISTVRNTPEIEHLPPAPRKEIQYLRCFLRIRKTKQGEQKRVLASESASHPSIYLFHPPRVFFFSFVSSPFVLASFVVEILVPPYLFLYSRFGFSLYYLLAFLFHPLFYGSAVHTNTKRKEMAR
jgi:hypothetical protein